MDPASGQQIVQAHPSWFDWITIAAIITGPVFALSAQRSLDRIREKKNRRVHLYVTVMSLRGTWLNPDSIRALNSIDTIFDKRGDGPVREAWSAVIAHVNTPRDPKAPELWNTRLVDLQTDLYQLLGTAVGYDHTIDYIKTQFYNPQYHVDVELEQMQIRKQLAKAITDDGLRVLLVDRAARPM
jgi:hypothetical protein